MMGVRGESGLSLIELLVTMAISIVVFGATLTALDVFQTNNLNAQLRNETQDNARNAVDRLSRQLRSVAAKSTGAPGALEVAKPYSIVFQTIDPSQVTAGNPTNAMRVRYCLNNSNPNNEILWTQVKRWKAESEAPLPTGAGCPNLNGSEWESSTQLVQHVTNRIGGRTSQPLFAYPASSVEQIASVEVNLLIDLNPGRRPGETQLTSGISLRNANRPPIASFTATKINGFVRLNASESLDPDGLALTYKWWKDGAQLSSTAQEYNTPAKETNGTHTYRLEVRDPGGLSNETERTVTIP